jgi:hypothetical protein
MGLFSMIFRAKPAARKSTDHWRSELIERHDWMLENIVRNNGEFTIEMRTAASEILAQRKLAATRTAELGR